MKTLAIFTLSSVALIIAAWTGINQLQSAQKERERKAHRQALHSLATGVVVALDRGASVSELRTKLNELETYQRSHAESFERSIKDSIEHMQTNFEVLAHFQTRVGPLDRNIIFLDTGDIRRLARIRIEKGESDIAHAYDRREAIDRSLANLRVESSVLTTLLSNR